jgi:DNA uptake protein ComE-like DNA-binding protein
LFRWYSEPPAAQTGLIDLNRASAAELESLEPLTPARCQRLLRERARGAFSHMADLQERLGLPAAVVEALIGRVCFGAASSGPELPLQRR